MKIIVKTSACVGHARCALAAPEVYELDDNGYIVTTDKVIPPELHVQAIRGARACPERIIQIVNDDEAK
ncbi:MULTISPECIES: ferredoxin [unclassified Pseudomonas]|uniref:ferredoxin n=1 Tax=unclassified Pseudomonas TaxID=196821 RepID=UPI0039B72F05